MFLLYSFNRFIGWSAIFTAQVQGTNQDHLQIFNIELKAKLKSHLMPEQVWFFFFFDDDILFSLALIIVYYILA